VGIFLEGINQERITDGYRRFQPGSGFLRTPIFLSSGLTDRIATIQQQTAVRNAMERTGFRNIRHETFPGGHTVIPAHVQAALRWFRTGH
jgi:predicted esterase